MATIKSASYNIHIGNDCFEKINTFLKKHSYSKLIIICDENSSEYCLPSLLFHCPKLNEAEIIELESGEENKTLETCANVWGALMDIQADRNSLIVNLGGGVITDLGGFIASTFKRGIHFVNIPTTLLSMVDASVGGKNGIDFNGVKNIIGCVAEPKALFINPDFIETQSERQIRNGFAEIIKIALIADSAFWKELKKGKQFFSEKIITKAIELKNNIVKKDLHEEDLRKSLNFGHSIGHALESAFLSQKKDILHGEAIAAGMIIESYLAFAQKRITKKECEEIVNYIRSVYPKIKITKEIKVLMDEYIKHDKKNEGTNLCFALPKNIGQYELSCNITKEEIEQALAQY